MDINHALLVLSLVTAAVALLRARWEYRSRGRLTAFGVLLLCAMLFLPNLLLHHQFSYTAPDSPLDYVGILIAAVGAVVCVLGMLRFRSLAKILCIDPQTLTTGGVYTFSRNPQYVGWLIFLFGVALTDWSAWCLAALTVIALALHALVLIEEEHLRRVFGRAYEDYCRKVPRYLGTGGARI